MILPESGRVIIVDNNPDEVKVLIRLLSQRRTAITYFTGKVEELPNKPFPDVRLIFLDVVLEGLTGKDTKTIISTLMGVLERIIDKDNNGPFVIVLWTKHLEHVKGLREALKIGNYRVILINLEKTEFFGTDGKTLMDDYELFTKLKKKINEKISEIDVFKVFILWDNIINTAASKTINEFSQLIEFREKNKWNAEMKKIFVKMAEAWAGETLNAKASKEIVKSALSTFNGVFEDTFGKLIQSENYSIPRVEFSSGGMNEEVVGKINTRLLLDSRNLENFYPGNVYRGRARKERILEILKDILNINDEATLDHIKNNSVPVFVETTPLCDFLQDKMKLSRIVKGVLLPKELIDSNGRHTNIWKKIKKDAEFTYITPVIYYNNKLYKLVLDFKYFSSQSSRDVKKRDAIFRLRKEILSDIQIKLSAHVSRTGVLFLE